MNIAKKAKGLRYRIEEKQLSYGPAPFITWLGITDFTAEQAMNVKFESGKQGEAKNWLSDILTSDTLAEDVYASAKKEGISE